MASITEFLEARIAEDEKQASAALETVAPDEWENPAEMGNFYPEDIAFWNRQTPRRVLAECTAKRALIDIAFAHEEEFDREWCGHEAEQIRAGECPLNRSHELLMLQTLAAVYKDHPDYRQEWAIGEG